MQIKHYFPYLLAFLLLTACSSRASQESFLTQQPSHSPEVIVFTPTPRIVDITPTHTLVPTPTNQILPTQTSTLANLEELPKLGDVVISSTDFENFKNIDAFRYNTLVQVTDVTSELKDSCLWDCVKHRYSLKYGTLTIVLLRAGDHQKAESTLENLRKDFLKSVGYFEYTASDIPTMLPGSWALVTDSSIKDHVTGAAGIAHGSIVIFVTYNRIGTDDVMDLAYYSVEFLNTQIQKLETAGYPK